MRKSNVNVFHHKVGPLLLCMVVAVANYGRAEVLPSVNQLNYQDRQLGAFVHFGPATYTGNSDMHEVVPASMFNPVDLDAEQWVQTAKSFGAKHVVLTAKHHNGFCLWQTATTDYSVASSPWKNGQGDVVAEFAAACKKHGVELGIYLSGGDANEAVTSTPTPMGTRTIVDPNNNYVDYTHKFKQQITELVTQYGDDISEMWFDGAWDPFGWDIVPPADPFAGTPDEGRLPADVFADVVHAYAPNTVIMGGTQADLRWSGNEDGTAPYPLYNEIQLGEGTSWYLPPDSEGWFACEANVFTRRHWFWTPNSDGTLLPVSSLENIYYSSIGNGANLLINMTPDTSGLIPAAEVQRLADFGAVIDAVYAQPNAATDSSGGWGTGNTLELEFDEAMDINHLVLEEDIANGQHINSYAVDAWEGNGWVQKFTGQTIGRKRIDAFTPFLTEKIRLRITNATGAPAITAMTAYGQVVDPGNPLEPGPALVTDDFNDGIIDSSKWITITNGTSSSITEANGVMAVQTHVGDRAYLVTADQWNPQYGTIAMEGDLSFLQGSSDPNFNFWARTSDHCDSSGLPNGGGVLSDGIFISYWQGAISAMEKVDTVWPWTEIGTSTSVPDPSSLNWHFVLTDDGTTITFTMTEANNPSNTAIWSAATAFDQGVYHLAYSATDILLDNVVITFDERDFLPGDANRDGIVNADDAALLAANWLKTSSAVWSEGDFNNDGAVDAADATLLAANWLTSSNGDNSVPEPAVLMLVLSGITLILLRSKR